MNGKLQNGKKLSSHRAAMLFAALCAALVALASPPKAHADTIYAYSGQAYTSCSGAYVAPCSAFSLIGSLDLTLPLESLANLNNFIVPIADVASFSFTDGLVTLDQNSATFSLLVLSTDALSQITSWGVGFTSVPISPALGSASLLSTAGRNGVTSFELSNHYPSDSTITAPPSIVVPPPDYSAFNRGGEYNPWSDPVDPPSTPEPATASLFAVGIAALVALSASTRCHRPAMDRWN